MSLQKIIDEENTDKYYIEYMQFLSNHMAHGIIALDRMGASEKRIRKFVEWYKDRLEPPRKDKITSGDIESLKGKRAAYYRILKYFKDLLHDNYKTIDNLIASELPKYIPGLGSSALHGTIHLGYGYSAKNEGTVCEGLAYLHHSYFPLVHKKPMPKASELGKGTRGPIELIKYIGADSAFHSTMVEEVKKEPWRSGVEGSFSQRMAYLITVHGDHFISLLGDLKLDIPRKEKGDIDMVELGKRVVDIAIMVYTMIEPANDFFILHGVTSAWSVRQILPALSEEHAFEMIETFLIVLMATYVIQDCPRLTVALNPVCQVDSKEWDDVIAKLLGLTADEHIYKVVQVLYDMWKEHPHNGHIYLQAAKSAIAKPLYFG